MARIATRAEVTPALLIAGAMPGARADGLRAFERGFREGAIERGDAADDMHVAIAELLGEPCLALDARLRRFADVATALAPCDDPALEALRRAIPAARVLPLLQALARHRAGPLQLDWPPGQSLALALDFT